MKYAKIQKLYKEVIQDKKLKEVSFWGYDLKRHDDVTVWRYNNKYKEGKRDRSGRANGKCIEFNTGAIVYLKNGILDREDGPALIEPFRLRWYVNGVLIKELNNKVTCKPEKLSLLLLKYSKI